MSTRLLALLFATLATAAEQRMGDFNPQNLANTEGPILLIELRS